MKKILQALLAIISISIYAPSGLSKDKPKSEDALVAEYSPVMLAVWSMSGKEIDQLSQEKQNELLSIAKKELEYQSVPFTIDKASAALLAIIWTPKYGPKEEGYPFIGYTGEIQLFGKVITAYSKRTVTIPLWKHSFYTIVSKDKLAFETQKLVRMYQFKYFESVRDEKNLSHNERVSNKR